MLLQALEQPLTRGPEARVRQVPVPVLGWNTRDKLNENPKYAPVLTNLIPRSGRLEMRRGYADHATGLSSSDDVESLMVYDANGTETMFAAIGTEVYDVTTAGAVGAAALTGLTNARWQYVMHATTSGQYLVAVNGADGVRTYNGSAWASQSISGVTASNLIGVIGHKARLWFIEKQTLSVWYLPTYAIAGTATELDVGALCQHGGELMAIATWSYDGGSGPDDYLVLITSQGEIVIYGGTDPDSVDTWALVGVFKVSRPILRRCTHKFGSDLAILTDDGVVLLSQVLNKVEQRDSFSDVIRDEFVAASLCGCHEYGWELRLYERRGWLIANVPTPAADDFDQYIINTLNGAWFRFQGMPAVCFAVMNGSLYFGGPNGGMFQADTGLSDDGASITIDFQPTWSRYGTSQKKRFTLVRPNLFTDGSVTPYISMKVDYDDTPSTATITAFSAPVGSIWDEDDWDDGVWGGGMTAASRWATVTGLGIVGAPRLRLSTTTAELAIASFDVAFEVGGII